MVKVFDAVPRQEGAEEFPGTTPLPFSLPGEDYVYAATVPKRATWQRTNLTARAKVTDSRKISALIDYLAGSLSNPEDRARFEERMLDGADPLDLIDLFPVVTWLSQVWTAQVKRHRNEKLTDTERALLAELEPASEPAPEEPAEPSAPEEPAEPSAPEPDDAAPVTNLPPVPPAG